MMKLGPLLNKNKTDANFSSENSLGIEGVAASMQAAICPVVTTVTPRAFYWAFLVWIYYDFYTNVPIKEKKKDFFIDYLRRQDFFFVAATLLSKNDDINLGGIRNVTKMIDGDSDIQFDNGYLRAAYGGMNDYTPGCASRDLICTKEGENDLPFPKLNSVSIEIGKSFETVIKETRYFKEYRLSESAVPRDVLIEYGQVINLSLDGFDEVKAILRHRFFDTDVRLSKCAEYITFLNKETQLDNLSPQTCRRLFFDHISDEGHPISIPENLKGISDAWEIVIGRMYFTIGLGMIWKYMLETIETPLKKGEWIDTVLCNAFDEVDIEKPISSLLPECRFDFDSREELIDNAEHSYESEYYAEDGLKILLSIYNWLKDRTDFGAEILFLDYGNESDSISLRTFERTVDEYLDKPLKSFLAFIMDKWLIVQHFNTAFEKLFYNIDGFFYEIIDDKFYKKHDYDVGFQGMRMTRLMKIMRDLDML